MVQTLHLSETAVLNSLSNPGVKVLVAQSCLTLCDPYTVACQTPPPWDSPGKNTEVGCHSLLQRFFPTQGLNPGLQNCRQILYYLSHQGSPSNSIVKSNHHFLRFVLRDLKRSSACGKAWVFCLSKGQRVWIRVYFSNKLLWRTWNVLRFLRIHKYSKLEHFALIVLFILNKASYNNL